MGKSFGELDLMPIFAIPFEARPYADVAQLARARELYSRGRGVDSLHRLKFPRVGRSSLKKEKGEYQSGQMGQTVNLLVFTFGGSNPSLPTTLRKK